MNQRTVVIALACVAVCSVIAVGGATGQVPAPNMVIGVDVVDENGNAIEKPVVIEARTPDGQRLDYVISDGNGEGNLDVPNPEGSSEIDLVVADTVIKTIDWQSGPSGETVQVSSETIDASVSVEVTDLPTAVDAGEDVPVSVNVVNDDRAEATTTLELRDTGSGETLASQTVTVPIGGANNDFVGETTTTLTWSATGSASGDIVVEVVASDGATSAEQIVTVTATDEEDDEDNGNQTDDGGDDADSGDGSNGGTGGGAGGGGGNGGVSTGDSADTADQTPTIQEIKDTLGLLDQPETETPITETNPETEGQTVTPTGTQTVQTIEFGSDVGGSVTIQEYETPPLKVAKQIRESIVADVAGISGTATTESGEPSDRAGGVNVTSVVDIRPTNESAQDASGTVTLRVNREAVTNPERLMVFKEEYVFEAQTEQWVQLNTTVTNTTAQHVTVRAEVSSFSLFAVTELNEEIDTGQTNETATNETAANETESTEPTDDGIPGFGAVVAVIAVIASAAVARRVSN